MSKSDNLTDEQKLSQLMDGEWQGLNSAECVAGICADDALRAKWARYHIIRDSLNNEPVQTGQALVNRICAAIGSEPSYSNITPFHTADARPDNAVQALQNDTAQLDAEHVSAGAALQQAGTQIDKAQSNTPRPSWIGSAASGFALAASVALVTVVGMNLFEKQGAPGAPTIANVDGSVTGTVPEAAAFVKNDTATLPVVEFVANTGAYWVSPNSSERVVDEERLNMLLARHIESSPTSSRNGLLPYSGLVGYEESRTER